MAPAGADDLTALAALEAASDLPPRPLAVWQRDWAAPAFYLLLARPRFSGGPIGFLSYSRVLEEISINQLAVAQAWRRQGVATALLTALQAAAVQAQVSQLLLEVRAGNAGARSFYRGLGFDEQGCRVGYYRQPLDDAILLIQRLVG